MSKKRILKTKLFSKWLKKSQLTDSELVAAVKEMEQGLYEAELGGNIYKKRVAIGNRGKSHGARTIVATKFQKHWFFLFGFEKNERTNINNVELAHLQSVALLLLDLTPSKIDKLLQEKTLAEVINGNDET